MSLLRWECLAKCSAPWWWALIAKTDWLACGQAAIYLSIKNTLIKSAFYIYRLFHQQCLLHSSISIPSGKSSFFHLQTINIAHLSIPHILRDELDSRWDRSTFVFSLINSHHQMPCVLFQYLLFHGDCSFIYQCLIKKIIFKRNEEHFGVYRLVMTQIRCLCINVGGQSVLISFPWIFFFLFALSRPGCLTGVMNKRRTK